MRAFMEHAVASEWGGESYRGYSFTQIRWRHGDYGFNAYAYMLNSPLHPNDIMYVLSNEVDDWREYVSPEATGSTVASNAVKSLHRLIDKAYDEPGTFRPTKLVA